MTNRTTHFRPTAVFGLLVVAILWALATTASAAPLGQIKETILRANDDPTQIVADATGRLWFTDPYDSSQDSTERSIPDKPTAPAIGVISAPSSYSFFATGLQPKLTSAPNGITTGPDGNVWFTDDPSDFFDGGHAAIGTITSLGAITEFTAGLNAMSFPTDIVTGPDGNLWFADEGATGAGNHLLGTPAVGRITPSGQITEFTAGLTASATRRPIDIVAGPDGNLWFALTGKPATVGKITPAGQITEFSSGFEHSGSGIQGIAAGADGNLWVTQASVPAAIARVTTSGHVTNFTSGLPLESSPATIAPGPGGLWFADSSLQAPAIGRITPSGKIAEFFGGLLTNATTPADITAGPNHSVWFTDPLAAAVGSIGTDSGPAPGADALVINCPSKIRFRTRFCRTGLMYRSALAKGRGATFNVTLSTYVSADLGAAVSKHPTLLGRGQTVGTQFVITVLSEPLPLYNGDGIFHATLTRRGHKAVTEDIRLF